LQHVIASEGCEQRANQVDDFFNELAVATENLVRSKEIHNQKSAKEMSAYAATPSLVRCRNQTKPQWQLSRIGNSSMKIRPHRRRRHKHRSALAGGRGTFFAGKMHGTFIKHCNLQHLGPRQPPLIFGVATLRQRLSQTRCGI